jgi:hypothetical protein
MKFGTRQATIVDTQVKEALNKSDFSFEPMRRTGAGSDDRRYQIFFAPIPCCQIGFDVLR